MHTNTEKLTTEQQNFIDAIASEGKILVPNKLQAFISERLSLFLEQQYSIKNQKKGKMDFGAAFIMGFDNHHQRNSIANKAFPNTLENNKEDKSTSWHIPLFKDCTTENRLGSTLRGRRVGNSQRCEAS